MIVRQRVQARFDAIQVIRDSVLPSEEKTEAVNRLADGADPGEVLVDYGLDFDQDDHPDASRCREMLLEMRENQAIEHGG